MVSHWHPEYYGRTDFAIKLDGDFAVETYDMDADQSRMNQLGNEVLDEHGINWKNPYNFKEDSFLVTSIHIGNNGKWVSTTDDPQGQEMTYYTHNIDTATEALAIQHLFGKWAKSAEALLEGQR